MSHDSDFMQDRVPGVIAPFTQRKETDWENIAHTIFVTFAIVACIAGIVGFAGSFFADDMVLFQIATLPVVAALLGLACLFGIASFLLGRAE